MDEHDELTGLYQREVFITRLEQALAQTPPDQRYTLAFLDIDHFMEYNQLFGHAAGDQWIRRVSALLVEAFGPGGLSGRYGGDEFVVAVPSDDPSAVYETAEALRARVAAENPDPGGEPQGEAQGRSYTVSLGLATFPSDASNVTELVEKASHALMQAKREGGNRVCYYEEKDLLTGLFNSFGILKKLDEAIEQARQQRSDLSILMADIDQFDSINQEYGRRAGDEVIRRTANILKSNFEPDGVIGRYYTGDQFMVILPGQRADSAFILFDEVRRLVEDSVETISIGGAKLQIRFHISGGVAAFPTDGADRVDLIRKADEAMYRAKRMGRNRICLPASSQMITKTSYYTQTQLERLAATARSLNKTEAFLLREALDDLLRKYDEMGIKG